MNSYFIGKVCNIEFKTPNGVRYIDKSVYLAALINPPRHLSNAESDTKGTFTHTIKPILDGSVYDDAIDKCILFIHYAALEAQLTTLTFTPSQDIVRELPQHLSVIDWINPLVKPSKSYVNYVESIRVSIRNAVELVRAIVCNDDTLVGGSKKKSRNTTGRKCTS
jgi:hypothetical protein